MMALLVVGSGAGLAGQGRGGQLPPNDPRLKTGPYTPSLIGWNDLETWSRPVGLEPDTERGVGLQLTGTQGKVLISFSATQLRTRPNAPIKQVAVTLVPGYDPTKVHWSSLSFEIVGRDKKLRTLDVSNRVVTYPTGPFGPGDSPIKGTVMLTDEEFLLVADAMSVKTTALGTSASMRPDQLQALRTFGQTIGLLIRR